MNTNTTADITFNAAEVAAIQMALDALDQRIAEKEHALGRDADWQEGLAALRHKLSDAAAQLPDPEETCRAYAIECLETGRHELGILLGHSENSDGLSDEELRRLWLNKVVAAGMAPDIALDFLNYRLSDEGRASR
jgi:hypothetical protein